MSINSIYAMDVNKVKRYGPIFHTIDFNFNGNLNARVYIESHSKSLKHVKVGTLTVGKINFNCTLMNLEELYNELGISQNSIWNSKPKEVEVTILGTNLTVTRHEYFRILDTIELALENVRKSYSMGMI